MSPNGKGEGRPQVCKANATSLTVRPDKGYYVSTPFKPFRSRRGSFNAAESTVLPEICYCGDHLNEHDSQGCGICGHKGVFVA